MADIETVANKLAAEKELAGTSAPAGEPALSVADAMGRQASTEAAPSTAATDGQPTKAAAAKSGETKPQPAAVAPTKPTAAVDEKPKHGGASSGTPPEDRGSEKKSANEDAGLIGAVDADQRIRTSAERGERTLWMSAVFVTLLYAAMIAAQVMDIGGFSALEQELAQQQRERERRGQGGDTISVELVPDPDLNSKTEKWREGANQPPNPAPPQPQQTAALPQPPVEQPQPVEQPAEQPPEKPDENAEQEPDKQEEKEPEKDEQKEAGEPTLPSIEALLDAAAQDLSEQVRAHYDRKPQRRRPQQQAMYSGGGMQVRGTGAGGKSDEFSKSVIDALMKTRPGPFALWGRVLVSFQITQQGDLLYVRVLQSSGNRAMDDAAVNAIHRAKFVKPPPGLSPEARTYIIDYIFG